MLCRIIAVITAFSRQSSIVNVWSEDRVSALATTLYGGSAVFLAIYGFGSAISFGVHLLMARLLGAKSYGYFVYASSWMAILLLGCNIGLKPTVVRFVAAYKARGEWSSLRGLLRCSTGWTIAVFRRGYHFVWNCALGYAPSFGRTRNDPRAHGARNAVHGTRRRLEFGCARAGSHRAFPVSGFDCPARVGRDYTGHHSFCLWRKWRSRLCGRSFSYRNHRHDDGGTVFSPTRTAPASADIAAPLLSRRVASRCRQQFSDLVVPSHSRSAHRRYFRRVSRRRNSLLIMSPRIGSPM